MSLGKTRDVNGMADKVIAERHQRKGRGQNNELSWDLGAQCGGRTLLRFGRGDVFGQARGQCFQLLVSKAVWRIREQGGEDVPAVSDFNGRARISLRQE